MTIEVFNHIFYFSRIGTKRYHCQIFRLTYLTESSKGSQSWSSTSFSERSKRNQNFAFCFSYVSSGTFQYLFATFFGYVYLRHFWNVFLHAREKQKWNRRCLQFQNFRPVVHFAVSGL